MYKKALILLLIPIFSLSMRATENRADIISTLHERLAATRPPADSIRILYNLFDLAAGADMAPPGSTNI